MLIQQLLTSATGRPANDPISAALYQLAALPVKDRISRGVICSSW
jgi:hypothetical protein